MVDTLVLIPFSSGLGSDGASMDVDIVEIPGLNPFFIRSRFGHDAV